MWTFEKGKTPVNVNVIPIEKWKNRYSTRGDIFNGRGYFELNDEIFRNADSSNRSYSHFAGRMRKAGLEPPNIIFREMKSIAARHILAIYSTTESVFNCLSVSGDSITIISTGEGEHQKVMYLIEEAPTSEAILPDEEEDSFEDFEPQEAEN